MKKMFVPLMAAMPFLAIGLAANPVLFKAKEVKVEPHCDFVEETKTYTINGEKYEVDHVCKTTNEYVTFTSGWTNEDNCYLDDTQGAVCQTENPTEVRLYGFVFVTKTDNGFKCTDKTGGNEAYGKTVSECIANYLKGNNNVNVEVKIENGNTLVIEYKANYENPVEFGYKDYFVRYNPTTKFGYVLPVVKVEGNTVYVDPSEFQTSKNAERMRALFEDVANSQTTVTQEETKETTTETTETTETEKKEETKEEETTTEAKQGEATEETKEQAEKTGEEKETEKEKMGEKETKETKQEQTKQETKQGFPTTYLLAAAVVIAAIAGAVYFFKQQQQEQ